MKLFLSRISAVVFVCLSYSACATAGTGELAQEAQLAAPFGVVEQVWVAASRGDTNQIAALTEGADPLDWVAARTEAVPDYFAATAGRLRLEGGYFVDEPGTVRLQFRVPYVSCPPPFHEGLDDTVRATVRRTSAGWKVTEIYEDIC